MRSRIGLKLISGVVLAASIVCGQAMAEGFPARKVSFIVVSSPGTATDLTARLAADALGRLWNAPVTVENRVGANGMLAAEAVLKAPPDGYTLLFTGPIHYVNRKLYKSIPYDPVKDFKPVSRIASSYLVLVAGQAQAFSTIPQLVAYAKANPGKVTYSSAGNGSTTHLAAALLASMTGIDLKHIPYKGGDHAFTDTIGGQVAITFTATATAAEQIKAGRIKALGISGPKRSVTLPDVPTIAEQGVPGYEMVAWLGILAPAGAPPSIVKAIDSAVAHVTKDPAFSEKLKVQYLEPDYRDTQYLARAMPTEIQWWDKVVQTSGAQLN